MASAAGLVEKATSDLLIGPDWAMNLDICDVINSDPGQSKDVVKAVKKRLNNKSPKVQLLALTVLETLVKNCGEMVHQQVAEKDVLHEMTKIVKKKTDMQVRDKILVLLDSWQEAFGGSRGRYPQYYMAFEELRRTGVEFPDRARDQNAPIFTPPQTQPISQSHGHGASAPGFSSPRLEAAMAADSANMSLTDIEAARSGAEVLTEMLNAVNPRDKEAVVDEVIMDLLEQSRTNQKRLMHLISTTSDEEILRQGLSLNDELQRVIAKHDAIASGSPLPRDPSIAGGHRFDHEEEAEDDFAQLAHRTSSRTRQATEGKAQDKAPAVQATPLPPPPKAKTLNVTPSKREMTVDLLSGDSYQDNSPQAPAAVPSGQTAMATLSPRSQVSSNPFDSDPAFQALPPFTSPQNSQPMYLERPQPHQQVHQYPYTNGLNSPTSPPPYGYGQHPFQQGQLGQGTGIQSYVVPWAASSNSPQYPQSPQSPHEQMQSQVGYSSVSSPWGGGGNGAPSLSQQQYAQQQLNSAQMSQQQRAMLYGSSGNNSPVLPPPPGQHSRRQQFFQQQQLQIQQQQNYYGSPSDLVGQTQNLSLQDRGRGMGSQPIGALQGAAAGNQQQPKEVNPADRLFEDLVDLSNPNSRFKTAGILSRGPSKTGSL